MRGRCNKLFKHKPHLMFADHFSLSELLRVWNGLPPNTIDFSTVFGRQGPSFSTSGQGFRPAWSSSGTAVDDHFVELLHIAGIHRRSRGFPTALLMLPT